MNKGKDEDKGNEQITIQSLSAMFQQLRSDIKNDISNEIKYEMSLMNDNLNEKLESFKRDQKDLKEEVQKQNKDLQYVDKEIRRKNIVIHGIEENEVETTQNHQAVLVETVLQLINNELKTNLTIGEIDFIGRIGKKMPNKKRPIKVILTTQRKKMAILSARKQMENGSYITEDFPPQVIETRKQLTPLMLEFRKNGKHAIIKYNKLVVDGMEVSETELNSKKRNQPDMSPVHSFLTEPRKNEVNPKKPKTSVTRPRANSIPNQGGLKKFLIESKDS